MTNKAKKIVQPTIPHVELKNILDKTFNTTIARTAYILNVNRSHLSQILHGRTQISALVALKLQMAGIGSAVHWLTLQHKFNKYLQFLKDNNIPQNLIPPPDPNKDPYRNKPSRKKSKPKNPN